MANTAFLITILIITLALLSPMAVSVEDEEEEEEEYVVDTPLSFSDSRTRSRFLLESHVIKKGRHCDNSSSVSSNNICNGISANKGRGLLFCCKKHCRDVVSEKNNCGECGHKCRQGERCCDGVCTNVLFNGGTHCGKCGNKCSPGVPCEYGFCGYA